MKLQKRLYYLEIGLFIFFQLLSILLVRFHDDIQQFLPWRWSELEADLSCVLAWIRIFVLIHLIVIRKKGYFDKYLKQYGVYYMIHWLVTYLVIIFFDLFHNAFNGSERMFVWGLLFLGIYYYRNHILKQKGSNCI